MKDVTQYMIDQNTRSVDIGVEQQWGSIKQAFQVTAEEVLGCKKGVEKAAWLSSGTHHIAEQSKEAKQRRKEGEVAAKHHNYLCQLVQILTAEKEIRDRWKRYFYGLYNDPNPINIANLPNMPEYAETESILGISQAEMESAVSKLCRRKAVGPNGISAEEIQAAASEKGLAVVHSLCTKLWESEHVPDSGSWL